MKKLKREEAKKIKGGINNYENSICSVKCANGIIKDHDCGNGTSCVAVPERYAVVCGSVEHCPCD